MPFWADSGSTAGRERQEHVGGRDPSGLGFIPRGAEGHVAEQVEKGPVDGPGLRFVTNPYWAKGSRYSAAVMRGTTISRRVRQKRRQLPAGGIGRRCRGHVVSDVSTA